MIKCNHFFHFFADHINFVGVHDEIGPFFVSVLLEEEDNKEKGYRTLVRTPRVQYTHKHTNKLTSLQKKQSY
jgi:hypothetical protein